MRPRTLSLTSSMALSKPHLPLRERCNVNLFIYILPRGDSEFEHLIITPGLHHNPDDPYTPQPEDEHDDEHDMDTDEEEEVARILTVMHTFCSSWTSIKTRCGSSTVWYPCQCTSSWAQKRVTEPIEILQLTYMISHLQLIIPGLFVAFLPDDANIMCHSTILHPDREFTHYISILTTAQMGLLSEVGHVRESTASCSCSAKRVELCVQDTHGKAHPGTRLSPTQIAFARDFLSLALNYPACMDGWFGSNAKVLVTTSASCPDDAMAIVTCFIAHAFGESHAKLARCLDSEPNINCKWRGLLTDPQTLDIIEEALYLSFD